MRVKPLTEHDLEFLSLLGGCTGSSECTLTSQNATLLEITCHGTNVLSFALLNKMAARANGSQS